MSSKAPPSAPSKPKGIRVTREQKGVLKSAFMFIPYPDHYPDSLSKLSADTGLDQEAIKKWFRNRRKKVSSKNIGNDDQEDLVEMQTDDANNSTDDTVDDTNKSSIEDTEDSLLEDSQPNAEVAGDISAPENLQNINDAANEVLANESVENESSIAIPEVPAHPAPQKGRKNATPKQKTPKAPSKRTTPNSQSRVTPYPIESLPIIPSQGLPTENVEKSKNVKLLIENDSHINEVIERTSDVLEEQSSSSMEDDHEPISVDPVNQTIQLDDTIDGKIVNHSMSDFSKDGQNSGSENKSEKSSDSVPHNSAVKRVNKEETKSLQGHEEMSTEEKAVQYDVLKNEFSALQNKFESLAKVLGSHGIDVGNETATSIPSTSQVPKPEEMQPNPPPYPPAGETVVQQNIVYPAGSTSEQTTNPEGVIPKIEPQPYGWPNQDYNQMYNQQQWTQYPQQYPPVQQYPSVYPNGYVAPYPPNYNLPYPPPQYPYHNQPHNPHYPPQALNESLPLQSLAVPEVTAHLAPQKGRKTATPKQKTPKAPSKRTTPNSQSRLTPYPRESLPIIPSQGSPSLLNQNTETDPQSKSFQGVIGAAKRSFSGPSKAKTQTPPKAAEVQTLFPPTSLPASHYAPVNKPRRKSVQAKAKIGAHPKPSPKAAPLAQVKQFEKSLQSTNPFRQTKPQGNIKPQTPLSRRKPLVATTRPGPEVQTLFPPITNSKPVRLPGKQTKQRLQRPEIEVLQRVNKKPSPPGPRSSNPFLGVTARKVPGPPTPSFPMNMMGSSISIQKVYNPLNDPNKPQELQKILAMSNLSVSLSRK